MFGDIMHGSMLLAAGIYICFAPAHKGSLVAAARPLRYFLLLMGIFSIFTGLVYNDYSSVSLYIFGPSCYTYVEGSKQPVDPNPDCVYKFGIDPSWYLSNDELTFLNSMKMKISVIFGVAQMTLGVICKGMNNVYNRSALDFIFEFIPQMVTLLAMFGFMDYMIVTKWLTDYSGVEG